MIGHHRELFFWVGNFVKYVSKVEEGFLVKLQTWFLELIIGLLKAGSFNLKGDTL